MGVQVDKAGRSNMAYNPNFQWKRKTVTITKGTDLPAGYQVKLIIVRSTDTPEAQADFRDLRFETLGGYGLPHWIESVVSGTATVWVKLKDALASPDTSVDMHMYYGNGIVASASNGTNTFDFFDDFSGTLNKWEQSSGGGWTTSNGIMSSPTVTFRTIGTDITLSSNFIVEGRNRDAIGAVYKFTKCAFGTSTKTSYSGGFETRMGYYYGNTLIDANYGNAYTFLANTYYKFRLTLAGTTSAKLEALSDDSTKTVLSTATKTVSPLSTNYMGISTADGEYQDWDYILVRRYVATEPATPTIGATVTTVNWNPQRKPITINNNSGGALTDYQVKLTIPFAPEMKNDFSDLRFVTDTGTVLNYWIESSTPGQTANIWIKVNLPNYGSGAPGNNTVYMHYGNPNLTSVSNGKNTFLAYSDGYDVASWTNSVTNVNGELHFAWGGTSASNKSISVSSPWIIEHRFRNETASNRNLYVMTGNGTGTYFPSNRVTSFWIDADEANLKVGANGSPITIYSSFALSTYYIVKQIKIGTNNFNHYLFDAARNLLGSSIGTVVNLGSDIDPITSISYGSGSGAWYINTYVTWVFIRKFIATEPTFSIGSAEAMNTFSYRKILTINNNSGSSLTDYQIPITVTYVSSMQANFNDIRFVDSNGNILPCWLESKTDSTTANFWIKVNLPLYGTSPTGDNIVYMYYGNPNLTSTSDGTNTFIQFSDFSNSSGLTLVGGWHVDNGMLSISSGGWATILLMENKDW